MLLISIVADLNFGIVVPEKFLNLRLAVCESTLCNGNRSPIKNSWCLRSPGLRKPVGIRACWCPANSHLEMARLWYLKWFGCVTVTSGSPIWENEEGWNDEDRWIQMKNLVGVLCYSCKSDRMLNQIQELKLFTIISYNFFLFNWRLDSPLWIGFCTIKRITSAPCGWRTKTEFLF